VIVELLQLHPQASLERALVLGGVHGEHGDKRLESRLVGGHAAHKVAQVRRQRGRRIAGA